MDFRHYRMENRPTLINGSEAWWLVDGEWRMLDTSEAFMNAVFIGESVFRRRFKFLPAASGRRFLGAYPPALIVASGRLSPHDSRSDKPRSELQTHAIRTRSRAHLAGRFKI